MVYKINVRGLDDKERSYMIALLVSIARKMSGSCMSIGFIRRGDFMIITGRQDIVGRIIRFFSNVYVLECDKKYVFKTFRNFSLQEAKFGIECLASFISGHTYPVSFYEGRNELFGCTILHTVVVPGDVISKEIIRVYGRMVKEEENKIKNTVENTAKQTIIELERETILV